MTRPFIIGMTGGSGSGKTTFLHLLKENFTDQQLCIISQDNYYKPSSEQSIDNEGILNYDLPTSINREEFVRDIHRLINGDTIIREEYTFNNPLRDPKLLVYKPAPILILEGIFVFHFHEISQLIDLRTFLYTSESVALSRRIKRDRIERNYPLEDVLYRYEHHVLPTFRKYIEPIKESADIIINNNRSFDKGLQVFTGFLTDYLSSLKSPKNETV